VVALEDGLKFSPSCIRLDGGFSMDLLGVPLDLCFSSSGMVAAFVR
jgi:hypothetical protein